MIGLLRGTVEHGLLVTACGIGYQVLTPHVLVDGEQTTLHVAEVGSETGSTLYGFEISWHREVFDVLAKTHGVAGKTALALMRDLGVPSLIAAVQDGDVKTLTMAAGVGPKLAGRIVAGCDLGPFAGHGETSDNAVADLTSALVSLGVAPSRARQAAVQVCEEHPGAADGELLVAALAAA